MLGEGKNFVEGGENTGKTFTDRVNQLCFYLWLYIFMKGPGKEARNSANPFSVVRKMPYSSLWLNQVSSEMSSSSKVLTISF